jgi:hypothetical protein
LFIPDPDPDFLPIPDKRGQKGTGSVSGSATLPAHRNFFTSSCGIINLH